MDILEYMGTGLIPAAQSLLVLVVLVPAGGASSFSGFYK